VTRTVAVFGGSFDPPHVVHVLAACWALAAHELDELLVVPCFRHPFGKKLAPFEDRLEMCRRAFHPLARASPCAIEREIGGVSKTLATLERLASEHPDWSLRLVVGTDVVADAPRWHRFDEVCRLAPLIVLGRAGEPCAAAAALVFPELSSTSVRRELRAGRLERVRAWVPHEVLAYVLERGLYGARAR
jgi:nicotinate-nucleotide adenylyltransferase